jgi:hypothetical protein
MHMRMRVLAILAVLSCTGCSIFLVDGPRGGAPNHCTDSVLFPGADAVATVGAVLLTIALQDAPSSSCASGSASGSAGCSGLNGTQVVLSSVAIAETVSAIVGFDRVGRCRETNRSP